MNYKTSSEFNWNEILSTYKNQTIIVSYQNPLQFIIPQKKLINKYTNSKPIISRMGICFTLRTMKTMKIEKHAQYLVQYWMKKGVQVSIPANGFCSIHYSEKTAVLLIEQTCCWQKGFNYFQILHTETQGSPESFNMRLFGITLILKITWKRGNYICLVESILM